ncbi:MAG TPA: TetR/AcrR family transcriptional regulator [Solirubrobacteraceae bacterium]|nr:TetR/AcrR family transcriptional regulator [Solirubrobacteraceae bacterium]
MEGGTTKRRRAGTRLVPRAVREEQMLTVAGEVFAAHGFHAASMDEIAERADISKPMLYAYFGSKEGLYSAYVDRAGAGLLARMDAAVDPALEPGEQVRASMMAFYGFVEEHRQGWAVMARELASSGGPFAESVARVRAKIVKRMASLLATRLPEHDADALAHGFVGAGESLAAWWLDHPSETREQVVQRVMDVGWNGIGSALTRE